MGGPTSGATTTSPQLHLATAPVNWNNNDIPGWRPLTPFPAILDQMVAAGYGATEYDASFGCDDLNLRAEAMKRGITWCGAYQWVDFLSRDALDSAIQALTPTLSLLNAIDCRHMIVADALRPHRVALAGRVAEDGSQSLTPSQVQDIADGVHRLATVAADHNVHIHYHNHVGTWIETPRELDSLLACLDPELVSLCFDTGHYAYGGGHASDFIRQHHASIGYLHVKDVNPVVLRSSRQDGLTFIDALKRYVFSPIGEGAADIPSILDVLVTNAYAGWVVVEQDTCEGDATATAKANLEYISSWLRGQSTNSLIEEGDFIP